MHLVPLFSEPDKVDELFKVRIGTFCLPADLAHIHFVAGSDEADQPVLGRGAHKWGVHRHPLQQGLDVSARRILQGQKILRLIILAYDVGMFGTEFLSLSKNFRFFPPKEHNAMILCAFCFVHLIYCQIL